MTPSENAAKYFCAAFQAEIKARGRGIQKELAAETGISMGLICDLNKGRTKGAAEKHRLLAQALGYSYEEFIARGRQLEPEKLAVQTTATSTFTGEETWEEKFRLAQKLIEAQEKIIAEMAENNRLRLELEALKRARQDSGGGVRDPSAESARNAPVVDAEGASVAGAE